MERSPEMFLFVVIQCFLEVTVDLGHQPADLN